MKSWEEHNKDSHKYSDWSRPGAPQLNNTGYAVLLAGFAGAALFVGLAIYGAVSLFR